MFCFIYEKLAFALSWLRHKFRVTKTLKWQH